VLRYVDVGKGCTNEQFIGYVAIEEATASVLIDTISRELELLGLSINNCRNQGYDSGANMVSMNSDVKTCIDYRRKCFYYTA
jgi:hypothetical protein